jgi:hypothetical protein
MVRQPSSSVLPRDGFAGRRRIGGEVREQVFAYQCVCRASLVGEIPSRAGCVRWNK